MDYYSLSPDELLQQCAQARSAAAWEAFISRFHPLVSGIVIRVARTRGAAMNLESLTQDVYLKLCAGEGKLLRNYRAKGRQPITAFLKLVTANAVRDLISHDQHLSDREFEALLAAQSDPSGLEQRWDSSAVYEEAARKLRRLRPETSAPPTSFCPQPEIWESISAGITAPEKAKGPLQHAGRCDYCGSLLREAIELFADERTPEEEAWVAESRLSTRKGRRKLAHRMAGHRPRRYIWTAAAAAVVLSAFKIWRSKRSRIGRLPLIIYAETRTIELRFSGAPYACYRQGDPGKFKTARWLEAKAAVARGARGMAVGPAILQARARINLLEWNFESALAQLQWAIGREPNSVSLLIDLATAHYERAEAGRREQDFAISINLLTRALAVGCDPVAWFNRALVYERMGLMEQAINDWQQYIRADPRGPWNVEAQQRLSELLKKVRESGEDSKS